MDYQIQRSLDGSTSSVVTESGILKSGQGVLRGMTCSTTSSGTIDLYDGLEAGAVATSTLTWANGGSSLVAAKHGKNILTQTGIAEGTHAATVLTSGGTNFTDAVKASAYITATVGQPTVGKKVTIGSEVYTFKAANTNGSRFDIPLGADYAATMVNLFKAIQGNEQVDAVHTSTYVITVTAKTGGTAGNSIAATTDESNLDWDGANTTLTGGLEAETVTIQGIVYTFKDIVKQAYDVKVGATLTASLLNLKYAINADTTNGKTDVNFGAGTIANTYVAATASDATTLTITARIPGVTPNAYTTTETCADASWAGGTMTNGTAGVATTTATVTIGTTVYTYVSVLSENIITGNTPIAYQVLKGSSVTTGLANLRKAINGTGIAGTDYSTGTVAHPDVVASASNATTLTIYTRTVGNAARTAVLNAIACTENMANTAWAGVDFTNGTTAAVTSDNALLTIGTRTYTVVNELSQTSGASAVVDQILFGANDAAFLDNLKLAINGTGIAGTNYSTGTTQNTQVEAAANAATTQVINARLLGVNGNAIATTSTCATYTWTSTVMASGTGTDSKKIVGTLTPAAGSNYKFENIEFERGLFAVVANTLNATVVFK